MRPLLRSLLPFLILALGCGNGTLGDINMTATIDGLASLTAAQKAGAKKYLGTARP